jgi:hypothetical protein
MIILVDAYKKSGVHACGILLTCPQPGKHPTEHHKTCYLVENQPPDAIDDQS